MPRLMHLASKLVSAVITLAIVAALVGAIALIVTPRVTHVTPVIVLTGSMEPALMTGGLAFMKPLPAAADPTAFVRVGDIITFRQEKNPKDQTSHRVTGIIESAEGRRFTTKGDNSPLPDTFETPATSVVGTIVYHVPYLGWIADSMKRPRSFLLFGSIPVAVIVIAEARNIWREARKQRYPADAELHESLRALAGK
jgi:signal peptidase